MFEQFTFVSGWFHPRPAINCVLVFHWFKDRYGYVTPRIALNFITTLMVAPNITCQHMNTGLLIFIRRNIKHFVGKDGLFMHCAANICIFYVYIIFHSCSICFSLLIIQRLALLQSVGCTRLQVCITMFAFCNSSNFVGVREPLVAIF